MVARLSVILVSGALVALCGCSSPEAKCIFAESPQHVAALKREFDLAGVPARGGADNSICVDADQWLEADRVKARVASYRYDAAVLLKSTEQVQRLTEALKREGKEFRVEAQTDRGVLVVVLSGSEAEAAANRTFLEGWE
jgi:hypothetical protein